MKWNYGNKFRILIKITKKKKKETLQARQVF